MIRRLIVLVVVALPSVSYAQGVEEPLGYRMEAYRSEVPASIEGGTVVDTDTAFALWKAGRTAFIDVLPRAPKPKGLPEGTVWRDKPRRSIPGSLWLPNVGYGEIAEQTDAYFRRGLAEATDKDRQAAVLLFCLEECWMSWNAAKRALEYGYAKVFWYPEGTDGWLAAGHPVETVLPVPE